jgi:lipoprotein-anchoring transpeptidase ErfK/SrfK
MKKAAVAAVLAVALAFAAAPSAQRTVVIEPGVVAGGVRIGGLATEPARALLERSFDRPLVLFRGKERVPVHPTRLGAGAAIDKAIVRALQAGPGAHVPLTVSYDETDVSSFVAWLSRRYHHDAVDARFVAMGSNGPVIAEGKAGVAVRAKAMRTLLERALLDGIRAALPVLVQPVQPAVTKADFGPVISIVRGANTLTLWDGTQRVRQFRVATGRAQYPTPSGTYAVVDMQQNPWWRPPNSDWARGLKPIPPGPGNPLGTRWMGLSAPGVGIHGTPDAASIGYSASHGCIRMQIPDAEWLFNHVRLGTPVAIL